MRLDYCALDDTGDIFCRRTGGVGDAPTNRYNGYWKSIQRYPPALEWVYLGHEQVVGSEGRTDIVLGRIKGSGRADRMWAHKGEPSGSGGAFTSLDLTLFENQGSGGTKLKGDGVFYCDMFGCGYDDYLWVRSNGEIRLFKNLQSPLDWGVHRLIIDINRDRKSIHFVILASNHHLIIQGDWDGDGLCDILSVERRTGQVEMWRNTYKEGDKSPTFASPVFVPPLAPACTLGWGLGLHDRAVRFGDLDGDGRIDYICMKPDGESSAILYTASGDKDLGQIKFAPKGNFDRANSGGLMYVQGFSVTGDGRVDLIWVNKFNGEVRVWKNGGLIPAAGSSMTWISQGTRFNGHGRGENIYFPKLGANGRADYHDVYPATAIANTWFNECPGGLDGYEGPYPDPNLPPIVIGPPLPDPDDSENEQLFEEALAMSNYDISQFETYNLSDLATRLIGFDRCDRFQRREIFSGWQQSWKIMNLIKTEADNGINFNESAAIEFLGAPAETRDLQAKFTAAFKQFSTIQPCWGGWFACKLAVRLVHIPSFNICDRYFDFDTLDYKHLGQSEHLLFEPGESLGPRAVPRRRESLNGDPHIADLKIGWLTNPPHTKWVYAYGSESTKALARFGRGWTQCNSDNYAMYTLARYVQKALRNIYPHLPLSSEVPDDVSPLYLGGSDIYQNGTGVLVNADDDSFSEWDVNDSECAALGDVPAATEASAFVAATGFPVQSDYPADYLSSWSLWAAEATAQR
ncbi:hypothetical protein CNMCM6069_003628 [Aspergillus lentulus]|nr:hypothetical protein CNMCM6069_003628 [Aspergillus lentulus]KAF4170563.1 hypothetical protein CNMCM8060_004813 [Aspergillus lentulus]KAF4188510.1 hypothetical protein CNMCM8694_004674 [Aspergillus lentulus]